MLVCLVTWASIAGLATCAAQEPQGNPGLTGSNLGSTPGAAIASSPRSGWTFRVRSPVTVSSPIVRLEDVIEPLNPEMEQWARLGRMPVGLLPLGSHPMKISRDRLHRVILDAVAGPVPIDWVGPTEIQVRFQESASSEQASVTSPVADDRSIRRVAYLANDSGDRNKAELSISELERIRHWVMLAIDRHYPDLSTNYRIEIANERTALASLGMITGVTEIEPLKELGPGDCPVRLVARRVDGAIESQLVLKLTAHPKVAVARTVLSRGHRLTSHDLELQPIPEQDLEPTHVRDPEDVLGMEIRSGARPGQPLDRSNLRTPIVIHRGDLIELRVMGGGVVVTTNAKSLGDGSVSDLIEVETTQPRKRLLARVVQAGLVEIVTRAPRVRP